MNGIVRLAATVLWAVAYVLVDIAAGCWCFVAGSRVSVPPAAVPTTPSSIQLRSWLARRLTSPPAAPRLGTT